MLFMKQNKIKRKNETILNVENNRRKFSGKKEKKKQF